MTNQKQPPKVFISYAWAEPDGDDWVLELAEDLVRNGVQVILDQWDLREGHDAFVFMEQSVTDASISKVIIVTDRRYCEKADAREGGAGTEAQIVSPEIYGKATQTKFVACPREHFEDGQPAIPTFYRGKIHIDFTDEADRDSSIEKLLRWIFDKPLRTPPALGEPPNFDRPKPLASPELSKLQKLSNQILEADLPKTSLLQRGVGLILEQLESQIEPVPSDDGDVDEVIFQRILATEETRHACADFIKVVFSEYSDEQLSDTFHAFLESAFSIISSHPNGRNSYNPWETDPTALLLHELFLMIIAEAIEARKFLTLTRVTDEAYFPEARHSDRDHSNFEIFSPRLESLEERKKRLELNRVSLHSDLLKDRCRSQREYAKIMEADIILYIKSLLIGKWYTWYPLLLIFLSRFDRSMPLIRRSRSKRAAEAITKILGVKDVNELKTRLKEIEAEPRNLVRVSHFPVHPSDILGLNEMGTID
jgi:hypothetical protein